MADARDVARAAKERVRRRVTIGPATVMPSGPEVLDLDTGERIPAAVQYMRERRRRLMRQPPPGDPGLGLDIPSGIVPAPEPLDLRPPGSPGVPRRGDLLLRAALLRLLSPRRGT